MSQHPAPVPRISPIEAPYEASIAQTFAHIMPPGMEPLTLFRTMARNPRVLQRMFAGNLLDKGTITLREREILILRTCARCGAEYEWGVHVTLFAKSAGLGQAHIDATVESAVSPVWTGPEAALIRLADELHDEAGVSDAAWTALAAHASQEQILEMIALCGYYHMISFMANAARLAPEVFAARFKREVPAIS
jgi:alkylhydroperoxidase family enzyme